MDFKPEPENILNVFLVFSKRFVIKLLFFNGCVGSISVTATDLLLTFEPSGVTARQETVTLRTLSAAVS